MHLIGFLLRATKWEWNIALKDRVTVFLQKSKSVCVTNERQYTAAGREIQVPWGGINEWRKAEQGVWYMDR